jgi:hypothetical protein
MTVASPVVTLSPQANGPRGGGCRGRHPLLTRSAALDNDASRVRLSRSLLEQIQHTPMIGKHWEYQPSPAQLSSAQLSSGTQLHLRSGLQRGGLQRGVQLLEQRQIDSSCWRRSSQTTRPAAPSGSAGPAVSDVGQGDAPTGASAAPGPGPAGRPGWRQSPGSEEMWNPARRVRRCVRPVRVTRRPAHRGAHLDLRDCPRLRDPARINAGFDARPGFAQP